MPNGNHPKDELTDVLGPPDTSLVDVLGEPDLKKKDSLPSSPSAITPTPTAPDISVSKSDLHQNIFGETTTTTPKISKGAVSSKDQGKLYQDKQKKESTTLSRLWDEKTPVDISLFADEKGSLVEKATKAAAAKAYTDEQRQQINVKKHNLTTNVFNGTLTGEDIDFISGMISPADKPNEGIPSDVRAEAINNKLRNIRNWTNHAIIKGVDSYTSQLADIDKQIEDLSNAMSPEVLPFFGETKPDNTAKIKDLQTQRAFLKHSIDQIYAYEQNNVISKLDSKLRNEVYSGKSWDEIIPETYTKETQYEKEHPELARGEGTQGKPPYFIERDPRTHKLTTASTASQLKFASDYLNKNKNKVIQVGEFGKEVDGENNNYVGTPTAWVDYLNSKPLIDYNNKIASDANLKKNPKIAPLINSYDKALEAVSKDNIDASEATTLAYQEDEKVLLNEKYLGKNGILTTNPEVLRIQHKHAEAVHAGLETDEMARKQATAEMESSPALKEINKQFDADMDKLKDRVQQKRADFLTNIVDKSVDQKMIVYPDMTIGYQGITKEESSKAIREHNNLLAKTTAETLHAQTEGAMAEANVRAGGGPINAFFGSWNQAFAEQRKALYNWYFSKTGWDGDNARMYQAQDIAKLPITSADVARGWNWEGAQSLLNPSFLMSQVGNMIPIMAPAAVASAITEGAGLPNAVEWAASAGIFTFQDGLTTYDRLRNSTDRFGNRLTEFDAANATAEQMNEEYFPNLVAMGLNLGTLSRAKSLTKPTASRAAIESVVGAALGAGPLQAQQFISYANQQKAAGNKVDIWDYLQDDHTSGLISGFIGMLGVGVPHSMIGFYRNTKNWKYLMASSEGEFRDNSLYNVALQHEINGNGEQFRDAAKLHIFNNFSKTPEEKGNIETLLQYSTALKKNIAGAGIDISNINGAYQAHNLALADLHDQWAEENKDNKNLSKIYSEQAKDFRQQAKNTMEGKGKFHYLIDSNDDPIFISDESFKALDANGKIAGWLDKGVIKSIHLSDDITFDSEYKKRIAKEQEEEPRRPPIVPKFEKGQAEHVVQTLREHRNQFSKGFEDAYGLHLDNPEMKDEDIAKEVISQAADNKTNMRKAIGEDAFTILEPIIDEQKELARPKVEDLPELRDKSETKKILNQKIEGLEMERKSRKEVTFEGKPVQIRDAIDLLKQRHQRLEDVINCL